MLTCTASLESFNPHPAFGPGATGCVSGDTQGTSLVSILTRPSGRVLQKTTGTPARKRGFQSSPGLRAGCYVHQWRMRDGLLEFQSSPGLRAGCYFWNEIIGHAGTKRFQSSPGLRAGCYQYEQCFINVPLCVSILTRPSGRVLRCGTGLAALHRMRFQSSPGLRAGCYSPFSIPPAQHPPSFNPHPAFGPGATRPASALGPPLPCFNPHPAFGPGATRRAATSGRRYPGFNPHPAFGPGATSRATR